MVAFALLGACEPPEENSSLTFTSTTVQGHEHTIDIQILSFISPPAGGIDQPTNEADGHRHSVQLTREELTQADEGEPVVKPTTFVQGHSHTFTFEREPGDGL